MASCSLFMRCLLVASRDEMSAPLLWLAALVTMAVVASAHDLKPRWVYKSGTTMAALTKAYGVPSYDTSVGGEILGAIDVQGRVHALDASTGNRLWVSTPVGNASQFWRLKTHRLGIVTLSICPFNFTRVCLTTLNSNNGSVRWTHVFPHQASNVVQNVVVSDTAVLTALSWGMLERRSLLNGTLLYVGGVSGNNVMALTDCSTAAVRPSAEQRQITGSVHALACVSLNWQLSLEFVGVLDMSTGHFSWTRSSPVTYWSTIRSTATSIVLSDDYKTIMVINRWTGKLRWQYSSPNGMHVQVMGVSPVLSSASRRKRLVCSVSAVAGIPESRSLLCWEELSGVTVVNTTTDGCINDGADPRVRTMCRHGSMSLDEDGRIFVMADTRNFTSHVDSTNLTVINATTGQMISNVATPIDGPHWFASTLLLESRRNAAWWVRTIPAGGAVAWNAATGSVFGTLSSTEEALELFTARLPNLAVMVTPDGVKAYTLMASAAP